MAEMNFGGGQIDPSNNTQDNQTYNTAQETTDNIFSSQTTNENNTMSASNNSSDVYSNEELKDPNRIVVTIADTQTPIVVLFGPPASGKTMTLVRLTRFLRNVGGYAVKPVTSFRPAYDRNYKKMCDEFDLLINSDDAAKSTSNINFMLVQVLNKAGKPICQILEAPGEHYFLGDSPKAPFPPYINKIKSSNNRKIWMFLVEPDATGEFTQEQRAFYAGKIANLKSSMPSRDKSIFVFNKIDASDYVLSRGKVNMPAAQTYIGGIYQGLYTPFENQNPITKWFSKYNCLFVPFQTGDYNIDANGETVFTEGPDEYPRQLWKTLLKCING